MSASNEARHTPNLAHWVREALAPLVLASLGTAPWPQTPQTPRRSSRTWSSRPALAFCSRPPRANITKLPHPGTLLTTDASDASSRPCFPFATLWCRRVRQTAASFGSTFCWASADTMAPNIAQILLLSPTSTCRACVDVLDQPRPDTTTINPVRFSRRARPLLLLARGQGLGQPTGVHLGCTLLLSLSLPLRRPALGCSRRRCPSPKVCSLRSFLQSWRLSSRLMHSSRKKCSEISTCQAPMQPSETSLMLMARFVKELVRSGLARARTGTSTTTTTTRIAERFFFDLNSATTQQKKTKRIGAEVQVWCHDEFSEFQFGAREKRWWSTSCGVMGGRRWDRSDHPQRSRQDERLDAKMANQFKTLVHRLEREVLGSTPKSKAPRALVLRGRGPAFCAGGDLGLLGEIARSDDLEGNARRLTELYASFLSIRRLTVKPQTRNQASSVAASAILVANVPALLTRHQTTVSLSDP